MQSSLQAIFWSQANQYSISSDTANSFMTASPIRAPAWVSTRRLFEQKLADLQKCMNVYHLKQVHAQIIKSNLHEDLYVAPKLISGYSLCHHLALSIKAFNQVEKPNVNCYNTLIRALAQSSQPFLAFSTFFDMQNSGIYPDNFTYSILLKACGGRNSLRMVEMIHAHIEKFGFCADIFVPNSLIDSYCKCGSMGVASARNMFRVMVVRDVVSWNSMICGLVRAGGLQEARNLFDEMPRRDVVTWNTILDAYVKAGEMNVAFDLFERMPDRNVVSWSTMVSGYVEYGDMDMARMLFDKMPAKTLVPWTIIVSGYTKKGHTKEAMKLYNEMEEIRLSPDDGAVISILSACAESGFLGLGKRIHESISRTKYHCSISVSNALIDMYAKCGSCGNALNVFEGMGRRDIVSWNAIIQGLAMHGHGENALHLFFRMKQDGFKPDKVTFIGVLCACTHMGFVDKGLKFFYGMESDYGIIPQVEHYGCLIDLLGRGGRLEEAFTLVHSMPFEPNVIIWGTLLGACRMHNNVELAQKVLEELVQLEPDDAGNFSMLSNIYAAVGDWRKVANTRVQMRNIRTPKPSGASSIEVNEEVHEFTVFDKSHQKSEWIYDVIDMLHDDGCQNFPHDVSLC